MHNFITPEHTALLGYLAAMAGAGVGAFFAARFMVMRDMHWIGRAVWGVLALVGGSAFVGMAWALNVVVAQLA